MDYRNPYVMRNLKLDKYIRDHVRSQMTRQKVIFLDIDGVIQPISSQKRFGYQWDELCNYLVEKYHNPLYTKMDKADVIAAYQDWDTVALGRIRELAKETNASIVLHTGWCQFNSLENMRALFALYGMDDMIVDAVDLSGFRNKAVAIREYLEQHPEIQDFVIIDDDRMLTEKFPLNSVLTSRVYRAEDDACAWAILTGGLGVRMDDNKMTLFRKYDDQTTDCVSIDISYDDNKLLILDKIEFDGWVSNSPAYLAIMLSTLKIICEKASLLGFGAEEAIVLGMDEAEEKALERMMRKSYWEDRHYRKIIYYRWAAEWPERVDYARGFYREEIPEVLREKLVKACSEVFAHRLMLVDAVKEE